MSDNLDQQISKQDFETLERQLQRRPRGVRAIEVRCPSGHPLVIRVHPLIDEKPFPTLFWLTCPSVIAQISRIEHLGHIQKLESILKDHPEMMKRYHDNHRSYIEERLRQLSAGEKSHAKSQGYLKVLEQCGIGGIRDWNTIKCMHLQYAHHLARENEIGEWIDENFQISLCEASVSSTTSE